MMFKQLVQKYQQWKERRILLRLRKELSFWGIDTTHLTNGEIKQGVAELSRVVSQCGVTVKEAEAGLYRIVQALA